MDEIVPTSIPGQINKITLEYQRNVRFIQKNEEGTENETVNWDYKEEMILDRYEETLTIRQVIAPGRELTKEYHMRDEIPELMDKCMEYLGKLESASGPKESESAEFKLCLECGASASRVVTGTYNRRGLPEGWDAFIREIAGYIRFYESYEDILNPYIYRRGRRQGEQIICSVIFHEKESGIRTGQRMKIWKWGIKCWFRRDRTNRSFPVRSCQLIIIKNQICRKNSEILVRF